MAENESVLAKVMLGNASVKTKRAPPISDPAIILFKIFITFPEYVNWISVYPKLLLSPQRPPTLVNDLLRSAAILFSGRTCHLDFCVLNLTVGHRCITSLLIKPGITSDFDLNKLFNATFGLVNILNPYIDKGHTPRSFVNSFELCVELWRRRLTRAFIDKRLLSENVFYNASYRNQFFLPPFLQLL